jgi:hypothetical protein
VRAAVQAVQAIRAAAAAVRVVHAVLAARVSSPSEKVEGHGLRRGLLLLQARRVLQFFRNSFPSKQE